MRIFFRIYLILFCLFFSKLALALPPSSQCHGVAPINVTGFNDIYQAFSDISHSRNLRRYVTADKVAFVLCFESFRGGTFIDSLKTSVLINGTELPVIISGLRLVGSPGFQGPLIEVWGSNVRIENTSVRCSNKNEGGTGIQLFGDYHRVLSSDIASCGTGIQIGGVTEEGNNITVGPDTFDSTLKVSVHDNGTGFRIVRGTGNFLKYNALYDNGLENQCDGKEGIRLEPEANGGIQIPSILENQDAPPNSFLRYVSFTNNRGETIIRLTSSYPEGLLQLYFSGSNRLRSCPMQGKEFYRNGELISSEPDGKGKYILTFRFNVDPYFMSRNTILQFHHSVLGSSSYVALLHPGVPPGITSTPTLDDVELTADSSGQPLPFPDDEEKKTETSKQESGMLPASFNGDQSVEAVEPMGMKCSLNTNSAFDRHSFTVLLLAGFFLVAIRFQLKRQ